MVAKRKIFSKEKAGLNPAFSFNAHKSPAVVSAG
jgi:hypothetical protein